MSHTRKTGNQDEGHSGRDKFHIGRFLTVHPVESKNVSFDCGPMVLIKQSLQVNVKEISESSSNSFRVLLYKASDYEAVGLKIEETSRRFYLCGVEVLVFLSDNVNLLCVAHLPKNFTEAEFEKLVTSQGDVSWSFMMRNKYTKKFGRYGFVRYTDVNTANRAKRFFHNRLKKTSHLYCDWINTKFNTFEDLHSSCIFVENLPRHYYNSEHYEDFRLIFSEIAKPLYSQIILNRAKSTGNGIVEFSSSVEASKTYLALENSKIGEQSIELSFCIPGVKAADVVNRIDYNTGLLHDPPANLASLPSLQLFCMENPEENSRYLTNIQEAVKSHVKFKDDKNDCSTLEAKTFQKSGTAPLNVAPMEVPKFFPPQLSGHIENIPFANPNNQLQLLQILNHEKNQANNYQQNSIHSFSPFQTAPAHPAHQFLPLNPNFVNFRQPNNNFGVFPHYVTPIPAKLNSPEGIASNPAYSIGLPAENKPQRFSPQFVLTSPVYEGVSTSVRHMPYYRAPKGERSFMKSRSSKTNLADASHFERRNEDLLKLPDYTNRQATDWATPNNQVQFNPSFQQIWDYKPVKSLEQMHTNVKPLHILPSPEISPDITQAVIGQHSQGIGGHYADTYLRRKIF